MTEYYKTSDFMTATYLMYHMLGGTLNFVGMSGPVYKAEFNFEPAHYAESLAEQLKKPGTDVDLYLLKNGYNSAKGELSAYKRQI